MNSKITAMTWDGLADAAPRLGLTQKQAQNAALMLYEAGFITYPYSHCGSVPSFCKHDVDATLAVVEATLPGMTAGVVVNLDGGFFSDHLEVAHHAIIPEHRLASRRSCLSDLPADAAIVYRLIAESYLTALAG